jgi:hypothetical protein
MEEPVKQTIQRAYTEAREQFRFEAYRTREILRDVFGVRGSLRRYDEHTSGHRGGAAVRHFVEDGALWAAVGASEDEGAKRAAMIADQLFRTGYRSGK